MYSKSLADENSNYISTISPEIFEKIVASLPYNPDLANLSMTSKELQFQVLGTPCGDYVNELNALQPSYLSSFFAKDYGLTSFCFGGACLGMAIGGYFNYGTILSTYLGTIPGAVVGGAVSGAIGGFVIDGFEGAKNGMSLCATTMFPLKPVGMLIAKAQFKCIDTIISYGTQKNVTTFGNIIKTRPVEILDDHSKQCRKYINFFEEKNRDFRVNLQNKVSEKHHQLSQPIARKGI